MVVVVSAEVDDKARSFAFNRVEPAPSDALTVWLTILTATDAPTPT